MKSTPDPFRNSSELDKSSPRQRGSSAVEIYPGTSKGIRLVPGWTLRLLKQKNVRVERRELEQRFLQWESA